MFTECRSPMFLIGSLVLAELTATRTLRASATLHPELVGPRLAAARPRTALGPDPVALSRCESDFQSVGAEGLRPASGPASRSASGCVSIRRDGFGAQTDPPQAAEGGV